MIKFSLPWELQLLFMVVSAVVIIISSYAIVRISRETEVTGVGWGMTVGFFLLAFAACLGGALMVFFLGGVL